MSNLRLRIYKAIDSTTIKARFTEELSPLINTSNVVVTSIIPGVPDPTVLRVTVDLDVLTIKTRPMTPFSSYQVTFRSTDSAEFKSRNGTSFLLEDSQTNIVPLLGPEDPSDSVRQFLINFLKDGIYNLDTGTLVRKIINNQARLLSKAIHDIRQVKNENYLQVDIIDEPKVRGSGPFDRLNEEGAYEVIRVGRSFTNTNLPGSVSFQSFPRSPITLQAQTVASETLEAGSGPSTFDGLVLTLNQRFITKLNSLRINYAAGGMAVYDISSFGYQLKDARFDDFASNFLLLEDNQIRLSELSIEQGFVAPVPGDEVIISYDFQNRGRFIDSESVVVSQVLDAIREPTPAIITQFSLDNNPVVDANDNIANFGGVTFLDPEANPPFSETHPAFLRELPFRVGGLPRNPGEFSVDYENGVVYVYGAEDNDGTGFYPPTATYKYRNVFRADLDYTYDPETYQVVANPLRDLATQQIKVSFNFEDTLVPDVDFKAQVHQEVINERVDNRLLNTNSLRVNNPPITNVFRIFNESTGEIYRLSRFDESKIVFIANNPPRIEDQVRERANFKDVFNETLLVNTESVNSNFIRVMSIPLANSNIMASTEDAIGSSYNSSASFSRNDLFVTERYFDSQVTTPAANIARIAEVGEYQIDYENGVVYVGVTTNQSADLGSITYKAPVISPNNPHVISVSEIYNSLSDLTGISKRIRLSSFADGEITPLNFERSDERFLNGDETLSYTVSANVINVQDDIKNLRNIYDILDLQNNIEPTNFAEGATFTGSTITIDSTGVPKQSTSVVEVGNIVNVPVVSTNASIFSVSSVKRLSDNVELYDVGGSFSGYEIILSGTGSPVPGDEVVVTYRVVLDGGATPIVDYNRGDYFVDYTYVADEILVSYEYGDNVLDFRESGTLDEGDEYFVSYKVGALRDALLANFGSLIDLPTINTFDTSLPRESYRDAVQGALQSFTKGPTIPAIEGLVKSISHINPDIVEAAFEVWSLGNSYLYPNAIGYSDSVGLMAGKFDTGVYLNNPTDTVTFPVSSNLKLDDGSLEMWFVPDWDGLDNDATLTLNVTKNGSPIAASEVFIGSTSYNPTIADDGSFTVSRFDTRTSIGLPPKVYTHTGFFVYYDDEAKRWNVLARDSITGPDNVYAGTVVSSGEVYDVKFIPGLGELNDVLRSGRTSFEFEFNLDAAGDGYSPDGYNDGYNSIPGDGYVPGFSFDGVTFMADQLHYLFDFGETESTNRFSLYKDGKGYLNFRVYDRGNPVTNRKNEYKLSADISSWRAGEQHHIGLAWKINSENRQDEMHLFIDGEEVPNILRYGGRPVATSTDRFRTVKPELVVGTVTLPAVTGSDLITVAGSDTVTSPTIDFGAAGIVPGHTIRIIEDSFTTYTVLGVATNSLVLDSVMPATLSDARFSINEFSTVVSTRVNLFTNIAVSRIDTNGVETEIPGLRADIPAYSISKNGFNQDVFTLLGNAEVGDQIVIRTLGLNHRRCRETHYVWGNTSNIIRTQLPPPISLTEAIIKPVILSLTPIGPDNATLVSGRFEALGLDTTNQPSSDTEGRILSVRVTGSNVVFADDVEVTINGTTFSGATSETLVFSQAETQDTSERWLTVSSIDGYATPVVSSRDSSAIEIKEKYSITFADGNVSYPLLRFSYITQLGEDLEGTIGSNTLTDNEKFFPASDIGNLLVISSPAPVAGTYQITGRIDNNNVTVTPALPASFTNGIYNVYNVSIANSGFQNGWFTFEIAGSAGEPYLLNEGIYEFDYAAYLEIPFKNLSNELAYVGSDLNGNNQAGGVIDELRTLTRAISDVRVGETLAVNDKSFTTSFNSLLPFNADIETLMLLSFDSLPFENEADIWVLADKFFMQSSTSVNDNFDKSIVLTQNTLSYDNAGLLNTRSEGTIEFWVSPKFDTYNDPNFRFYFDANAASVEQVTSITTGTLAVNRNISEVLSVRLLTDVEGTGVNYFTGGSIAADSRTINLGRALPAQRTPVEVVYIPTGVSGDRISIFKDQEGFVVFNVRANNVDYQARQPVFWARDTWHRIKCSFKFNRPDNLDEVRMFIDGEERGVITFGSGLLFGSGIIFGQGFAGVNDAVLISDINFTDTINQIFIGSDFRGANKAQARIDNLRISNISRPPTVISGQNKDTVYNTNLDIVFPVIEDAFTTFLLDFDTISFKSNDFADLRDEEFGIFNFTLNVIDSFDIVLSNPKIQQLLEELVLALKPAQSKVTINYIQ
jgi:hypothetical protein